MDTITNVKSLPSSISYVKNSGSLVDKGYIAPYMIRGEMPRIGVIPSSMGFKPFIPDWNKFKTSRRMKLSLDDVIGLSKLEISHLSNVQKRALAFFTSDEYEWVNRAVYQGGFEKNTGFFNLVKILDSALSTDNNVQKIVYRGVSTANGVLNNSNFADLRVGSVLEFKGYQSATYDINIADGYISQNSKNDGVIFEILTSQGVNVTSISNYDIEAEVMLPRNMRFLIIGSYVTYNNNAKDKKRVVQVVSVDEKMNIR